MHELFFARTARLRRSSDGSLGLLVDRVVPFPFRVCGQLRRTFWYGSVDSIRRAGDDERRTGFVDEDGVHFVDDGVMVAALHQLLGVEFHVVAQVVEAELVVRAVGDVRAVRFLALFSSLRPATMTPTERPRKLYSRPIHSASRLAR